jgi:hypothetical protein
MENEMVIKECSVLSYYNIQVVHSCSYIIFGQNMIVRLGCEHHCTRPMNAHDACIGLEI